MVSVIWNKRALPIYWLLLDKKGSSDFYEQRLTNLILLIAIAYTASCLTGLKIRNSGQAEYINRLKLEGKNRPRHSYFWTGLYGTTWVLSMDMCWHWVEKLMRTAINKLSFYQKGIRAMKLMQSKV